MIGTNNQASASMPGLTGTVGAAIGAQTAGSPSAMQQQFAAQTSGSVSGAVYVLLFLAALWVGWGVLVHHTNLGEKLNPANIAPNWHNWLHIGIVASVFLVAMKILWTKATSWGVPGASYIAQFFAAT